MENSKIVHNLIHVGSFITAERANDLSDILKNESKDCNLQHISYELKSPTTTVLLSALLGGFGVDRFYIGDIGIGLGKLFSSIILLLIMPPLVIISYIWVFVDMFISHNKCRETNYQRIIGEIQTSKYSADFTSGIGFSLNDGSNLFGDKPVEPENTDIEN